VIYLSFNESSLLCSVWSQVDDDPILTQVTQIPLTGDLDNARGNDKVFNAILEQSFKSLASEVQLDGHNAYVTIPDYWAHHDFTAVDLGMGADDAWDFILWQKDQRLGEKGLDYLTYAESIQDNIKHVLHLPTLLISDIKLSISEYGAEPVWLGTESMVFTGSTNRTFGVISDAGTGYDLFVIKSKKLYAGSIRFLKGKWKVSKSFGFKSDLEKILSIHKNAPRKHLSPVYTLDKLSVKKQEHWSNNKLQFIKPFNNASIENAGDLEKMPYHLVAIQSMLIDDKFTGSGMNLFSAAGLIEKIEVPQVAEEKVDKIDPTQRDKKETKKQQKKKKRKPVDLQNVIVFITTAIIVLSFAMSVYLKMDEKKSIPKIHEQDQQSATTAQSSITDFLQLKGYPQQLIEIIQYSRSIMNGVRYVFETFPYNNVTFLSVSERDMQLEIVNGEELGADLTPLGAMVNYNVQGIDCCGGFKHFYDFLLPITTEMIANDIDDTESLQAALSNLDIQVERLQSIDRGKFTQIPYVLKASSEEKMKAVFSALLKLDDNIAIRKAVVKTDPETGDSQSVFYISVFERKGD